MVCLWKHAGIVDNLVRNILQLLMEIVNANHSQIIVNANIYLSALSVSKAGHPFQVFVFPYTLIFSILVFVVHIIAKSNHTG